MGSGSSKRAVLLTPRPKLQLVPWRELWDYRTLLALFVRRDFISSYKQTILGPLWFVIPPLVQTFVFTMIFGRVAKIDTGDAPQSLFFMSGVLVWNFFSSTLSKAAGTFAGSAGLFDKVYFPRLIVPLTGIANNLLTFAIQFLLFLSIYFYYSESFHTVDPKLTIVLAPLAVVQLSLLALGAGCLVTSVATKYRDFALMLGFGLQLWMYGSCVVYPLSAVPTEWQWVLLLNPVVPVIENFRYAFFGETIVTLPQMIIGWVVTVAILVAGLLAFNRAENNFVDTA
jgi:lipopolysaccharide transport system permease protein